jgi:hypothetical protein
MRGPNAVVGTVKEGQREGGEEGSEGRCAREAEGAEDEDAEEEVEDVGTWSGHTMACQDRQYPNFDITGTLAASPLLLPPKAPLTAAAPAPGLSTARECGDMRGRACGWTVQGISTGAGAEEVEVDDGTPIQPSDGEMRCCRVGAAVDDGAGTGECAACLWRRNTARGVALTT